MMYQFGSRPYDTTDRLGNLWVRRDQTTGEYFGTLLWASKNPQPAPADGRVSAASNPADYVTGLSANPGGWGRALVGSDRNDFAPRLGLAYQLDQKWHKALDGQSSLAEVKVQDPFNRRADYSRSSWDVRQVFNFSYVYELPFGKGQRLGGGMSSVADAIVGGWSLEGITRLETGPPVNLRVGRDTSNTGRHRQRPNLVGDPNAGLKTPDNWFNENAFALPAQYTFGTAAPYITDADGIVSFDIALQKQFALTESNSIELRAEFFNIPNHVNFNLPQENMRSGAYNTITSQSTNPRQIQLGLRWRF